MTDLAGRIAALPYDAKQRLLLHLQGRLGHEASARPVRVRRDGADFPLSFNQERLWFLDQLTPGNPFYNLASAQRIDFAIDAGVLHRSLIELAQRHEPLRTMFPIVRGEPVQRVTDTADISCEALTLDALAPAEREAEARHRAAVCAAAPFDLARGPLLRAQVIRLGPRRSLLVLVIHHIIADGWSLGILMRELASIYGELAAGRQPNLPELPLQYVDYAVWQRTRATAGETERELAFWRQKLDGLATLELPTDRPRPRVQRFAGHQLTARLPEPIVEAARRFAKREGTTLFVVLLAAFMALLQKYSGQDDIPVGVPVANRLRIEFEQVVGFFANTLVLRGDLGGNPTFTDLIGRIRGAVVEALEHQDLPFSTLVAALRLSPDLSRNPLFQVSFQLLAAVPGTRATAGEPSRSLAFDRTSSIFDLSVNLWEAGAAIEGLIEFDTDLFDRVTVERMVEHYLVLLGSAMQASDTKVSALPLLPETERTLVIETWNATTTEPPPAWFLHRLIERQATATPDASAVRQGVVALSFRELDARANSLAQRLMRLGLQPGDRIGVLARPSPDLMVAIVGALKAGGAFVPLDPVMPHLRLAGMLADCSARFVLTGGPVSDDGVAEKLADAGFFLVEFGDELAATELDGLVPYPDLTPEDVAYVMFTSGSTGRPKGVMIPHRAVVNYLSWCLATYPVAEGIGSPLCSPASSDMSITTLFLPLLAGKAVILLGSEHPVEELERLLRSGERFGFVKLTPSHLEALRLLSAGPLPPEATAALVVGGEPLRGEVLAPWRDQAPNVMIYNEYGPTETTVGCCCHALRAREVDRGPIPIGRPIANTRLYVVDRWGAPVPVGVVGELLIGGAGVGLGYVGRPDLTVERFIADPFVDDPAARLYRTGDRARWRADGTLEHLGRLDEQLKIRGYRVEPGEIESALREHETVSEAAVIGRELDGDDARLVAFVVQLAGTPRDINTWLQLLREHLASRIPAYMLPSAFVPLNALPLTASGKVDRRALAAIGAPTASRACDDTPPRDALEDIVSRIYCEVLGVARVGVRADFFVELGGHSLLAAKAVARLRDLLAIELPLRRMFETPTVEALAHSLLGGSPDPEQLGAVARVVLQVLDAGDDEISAMLGDGDL